MPEKPNVDILAPFFRKLDRLAPLSLADQDAIESLPRRVVAVHAGQDVEPPLHSESVLPVMIDGMGYTSKFVGSELRQITAIHLAGDTPNLASSHFPSDDSLFTAITPCKIGVIDLRELRLDIRPFLYELALSDARIHREWIANIGRRSALQRIAHLICELTFRVRLIDPYNSIPPDLPLLQAIIADATALSLAHVNKKIHILKAMKLVVLKERSIRVNDWTRLVELAEFDPGYLQSAVSISGS